MTMISVLYVDDEPGLLEIEKLFLERIGTITVDIVSSALDALHRLASISYDVIVSDCQMPGMDGIELLQKIRMSSDIPFILFTDRSREEVVVTALDSGADYYVQKGGTPKAQFAELSHYINQIALHRIVKGELQREREFSRAMLENLSINPDDQHQVEVLPCPVKEPGHTSQYSTPGGRVPVSFRRNSGESPSSDISKISNPNAQFARLSDRIHQLVTGKGDRSGLFEEQVVSNILLEDLVIGPEDLYRIEVLPCPSWEPASRSCHTGAY